MDAQAAMKSDASAQMIMDGDNKIAALAINNKDGEALNIADPSVPVLPCLQALDPTPQCPAAPLRLGFRLASSLAAPLRHVALHTL